MSLKRKPAVPALAVTAAHGPPRSWGAQVCKGLLDMSGPAVAPAEWFDLESLSDSSQATS